MVVNCTQAYVMKCLLLLAFIGTMWVSSTQGQRGDFVLRFSRRIQNLPNRILMECRDSFDDTLVPEPSFFRNGLPFSLPNIRDIPGFGVRFDVDRTTEGNFTCGEEGRTSTPPMTIVTRPDPANDMPEMETFYADVGSTARLDCSITPGALTFLYHVIWRNASNHNMIFYQIFPLRNTGRLEPSGLDQRYSLDFQNFSLSISDVGLDDAASDYQCVLGVVDPMDNTEFPFTSTQYINLSLSLYTAPEFVIEPTSQVVIAGANVTFLCTVFSSPLASSIGWRLRGTILDRHDERIAIVSNLESVNSGMRTSSSLTISKVTGFDSDVVECFSEYFVNAAVMLSTVRSEATLSVLDEVQLEQPIPLEGGGFKFPMVPKRPLLIPVMVQLRYTDAGNPERQITNKSPSNFTNTTRIIVTALPSEVPPYDSFFLGVSLVYLDVIGPMVQYVDAIRNIPGFDSSQITLLSTSVVASVIALLICACSMFCLWRCHKRQKRMLSMIEYDAKIEKIRIPLVTNEANEEQSHVYVLAIEEQSVSDQQYEGDCHMSHFIQDGHHSYAEPNQRRDIHSSSGDTQGDRYGSNQDVLYKNNQPTQRHCDVGVTPMENPPREATTENPPEVTTHNCLDKVDATKDLLKRNASDHPLERDATEGFLEGVTTENLMGNPPREASTENPPEVDEVDTIVKRNATDYPPEWDATKKTEKEPLAPLPTLTAPDFGTYAPIKAYICDQCGAVLSMGGITVTIPFGAIPEGITAHIEMGVALYLPFKLPENYQLVSPILWFCIKDDIKLLLPIEYKLPHVITDISRGKLTFAKAGHTDNPVFELLQHDNVNFTPSNPRLRKYGYGNLSIKHCCYLCIGAISKDVALESGYCLHTLIKKETDSQYQILLLCTYFLETCLDALKTSYPEETPEKEGYEYYSREPFEFEDPRLEKEGYEYYSREPFEFEDPRRLVITPTSEDDLKIKSKHGNEIRVSDVNFWRGGIARLHRMKLEHENKIYPPSVTVLVYSNRPGSQTAEVTLDVKGMREPTPRTITVVKNFTVGHRDKPLKASIGWELGKEPSHWDSPTKIGMVGTYASPISSLELILDWDNDSERDLIRIAHCMLEWEEKLCPHLELTNVDIHDIKEMYKDKPEMQRRAVLRRWKEKQGLRATYQNLLAVFVKACHFQCATAIFNVLEKHS